MIKIKTHIAKNYAHNNPHVGTILVMKPSMKYDHQSIVGRSLNKPSTYHVQFLELGTCKRLRKVFAVEERFDFDTGLVL